MVGHMFQNYDPVYARFFPTYSCNHSCYTIYVRFFVTYTCVLSCFVGTNAHIHAHKKVHIYALQTSMWYMGSHAIIPATRYTCVFLSRILAFFPALWVQTRIYMRTKKYIYMRYKQACGIWGHRKWSYKSHRIIPSAKKPFMYDGAER